MIGTQTKAKIKGKKVATPSDINDTITSKGRMNAAVYFKMFDVLWLMVDGPIDTTHFTQS